MHVGIYADNLTPADDEDVQEEEEDQHVEKKLKFGAVGKNPNVITGFLPDRYFSSLHVTLNATVSPA